MKISKIYGQFLLYGLGAALIVGYVKYMNHQDYVYDECFKSSVVNAPKDSSPAASHLALDVCMKANGYDYSAFSQCSFISNEEMCFTPSFLSTK